MPSIFFLNLPTLHVLFIEQQLHFIFNRSFNVFSVNFFSNMSLTMVFGVEVCLLGDFILDLVGS